MKNSLTYLTRHCPRACEYCALRDAKDVGKELSIQQWIKAFVILKEMNIDFNLVLGNETWLLGESLLDIFTPNEVPYALYTTCPEPIFSKYRNKLFGSGIIDNLSCGIDYPRNIPANHPGRKDDSYIKSLSALEGFTWLKKHHPKMDCQGTVTIHKGNYEMLPTLVQELSELGVFIGVNFIHWNKDGGFDFFPEKSELGDLLFDAMDIPKVRKIMDEVLINPGLLQNPQMLQVNTQTMLNMGWHCEGNPYGGPTIDADGTLRVCGYRKGKRTPNFSIFDLPAAEEEWADAVYQDAMECPGCAWSYPWMFHYWQSQDSEMGKNVFIQHGGTHIERNKWSKRKIQ